MKIILTFIATIILVQGYCQSESEQSYVFNSVLVREDTFTNAVISSHYYTLKNNIENKKSSVFISEKPTLDQILDAAINLNSDFFLINKREVMLNMIVIVNKPKRLFLVLTPPYMEKKELKCPLKGDISENRAAELIKEKYDPAARIEGNTLYFNSKKMKIISNQEIKSKVEDLIASEKLTEPNLSNTTILTQQELRALILTQSQKGGKLDFFTPIKGQEMNTVQLKPGTMTTKISMALYQWGKAVSDLGIHTLDDAIAIYTELMKQEPGEREQQYIKMGFNKVFE